MTAYLPLEEVLICGSGISSSGRRETFGFPLEISKTHLDSPTAYVVNLLGKELPR